MVALPMVRASRVPRSRCGGSMVSSSEASRSRVRVARCTGGDVDAGSSPGSAAGFARVAGWWWFNVRLRVICAVWSVLDRSRGV